MAWLGSVCRDHPGIAKVLVGFGVVPSGVEMNKVVKVNDEITNGGKQSIETELPYVATIRIRGVADILFHRWNADAVDTKAKAAKNSAAKKSDDVESYVYRDDKGMICIPGEYLRGATILAAKFKQDPRSPRKSAMDLFKAAVVSLTPLASLGAKEWDYEDRRRVVIQRAGINRVRPAMRAGWVCEFRMMVTLPEYVNQDLLHEVITLAGRIGGLGDFRPTYGRFSIVGFEVSEA
jgi:hypothetical protein